MAVRSLYVFLILNALVFALINVTIQTGNIPAGSSLLFTHTGPGIIPVESFVLLEKGNSLQLTSCTPKTPEGELECGILTAMAAQGIPLPFSLPGAIGSGSIIAHKGQHTYILTAAHVCIDSNVPPGSTNPSIIELEFSTHVVTIEYTSHTVISDYVGNKRNAEIVAADVQHDICIIRTEGVWGLAIPLAESPPPHGTKIQNMAAPLGIWAPEMILRFDGYFSGFDTYRGNQYSIYALPVAGGSSGSPVLYNGEIVSIIVMSSRGFENMGIGVMLEDIHALLDSI